ncbi:unnamed protein product [Amoebophrya sp. A120]|nr:unnamed protein product [Amoebophrya sp. A120]|eukprot:GSA120T00021360001.1
MVVCSYLHYLPEHFLATWAMFGLAGAVLVALLSTSAFRFLYMNPTLTKWQYKSSGKFPSAHYVREEIYQTFKGVFFATFFPALSMHLRKESYMKGYCPADVTGEADQEYYFSVLRYCWEFVLIVGITDQASPQVLQPDALRGDRRRAVRQLRARVAAVLPPALSHPELEHAVPHLYPLLLQLGHLPALRVRGGLDFSVGPPVDQHLVSALRAPR